MREVPAAVVHAVGAFVLKDGVVAGGVALPRRVGHQGDLLRDGAMQPQGRVAAYACYQVVVNQQLAARADVDNTLAVE